MKNETKEESMSVKFATSLIEPIRVILMRLSVAGVGKPVRRCRLLAALQKTGFWGTKRSNGYLTRAVRVLAELQFIERGRGGRTLKLLEPGEIACILPPADWGVEAIRARLAGKPPVPAPSEPLVPTGDPWWVVRQRRQRRRGSTASPVAADVGCDQDRALDAEPEFIPGVENVEATRLRVRRLMFPRYHEVELPLLRELACRGGTTAPRDLDSQGRTVYTALADEFGLTVDAREQQTLDGEGRPHWEKIVRWARQNLRKRELLLGGRRGFWEVSPAGSKFLQAQSHRRYANLR